MLLSAQLPQTPTASSLPAPPQIHYNVLFSTILDLQEPCKGLSVPSSQLQSTIALAHNLISSLSVGNENSEAKMVPANQLKVQKRKEDHLSYTTVSQHSLELGHAQSSPP